VTLVRRSDGRVRFLVREDLQDVDEDIAEYSDGSVILCTDQYTIYDGIEEYEDIDGHLAVNHSEQYVVGDAHVNSCENRHSFLRNWIRQFRGVSKHHLQGYLDFLCLVLNTDDWFEQIVGADFFT
jgi:hypothetical protein